MSIAYYFKHYDKKQFKHSCDGLSWALATLLSPDFCPPLLELEEERTRSQIPQF